MIINKSGITIRINVVNLNVIGRATQGVRLINLDKRNDEIASVCKVLSETEEEKIAGNVVSDNPESVLEEGIVKEEYSQIDAIEAEGSEKTTIED